MVISSWRRLCPERPTFPVHLMVRVVEVILLVRSVQVVDIYVEIVGRLPQVVLALVQRKADSGGGELLSLAGTSSLQGQRGRRDCNDKNNTGKQSLESSRDKK